VPLDKKSCKFTFPFPAKSREIFATLALNNLLKKSGIFENSDETEKKENIIEKVFLTSKNAVMSNVKTNKITLYIGDFISFYIGNEKEYVLKVKESFFDDGFEFEDCFSSIKEIVENENNTIILYGKKQLRKDLEEKGIILKAKIEDVMLLKYLTDFTGKEETLEEVFAVKSLDKTTPAYSLNCLYTELMKKADEREKAIYNDIELPLADVLFDMEKEGFKISAKNLEEMSEYYSDKISVLNKKIDELAGEKINVNSPKKLADFLYNKLGLKHGKKNKNGYSTNVDSLESLVEEHPVIPLILEYRKYSKLLSTYIDGFRPLIDKKTGLVHTTFYQAQTSTGRLSSRKPNLQNIPVRTEEGKEIRKLFTARSEDRVLIDADYSQIELRLLAAFSGCAPLIEAFKTGRDAHAETAAKVFGVTIDKVTPFMRRSAKAVNFGIIYGISEYGLAENIGVKPKEAAQYIKNYFETYPEVKAYMDSNVKKAKECGYAVTMTGRKRYIREINASNYNLRQFGERAAMNMPLQGSAADIIKIAMINVYGRLKKENLKSKLILQVHDELIVDAFKTEAEQVKKIVKEEMENAVKLSVPLTVSLSEAENWYDCK
ncbi:MAG TPA: DNA polymerase I, partial [Clostridiales bacterium]|nr:DNA polymerase I [Clostridiales bacterium]